jgi:hypothetical protein
MGRSRRPDQAPKMVLRAKAVFLFMSFSIRIIFIIGGSPSERIYRMTCGAIRGVKAASTFI